MPGDTEQTDSSGKYTFGGGASAAKKYWPTILKSMELVFCILCLGLVDDPSQSQRASSGHVFISQRVVALVYVTFGSYLIYSAIYLIGKLIRDEWPWKTTAIMACLATFLFFLCSMFLFKNWSDAKTRNSWPPNTTSPELQQQQMLQQMQQQMQQNMQQQLQAQQQQQQQTPQQQQPQMPPLIQNGPNGPLEPTKGLDLIFVSGSIAFITAITYLVDAILMIRAGNRGEFEY